MSSFEKLNLISPILSALSEEGYTTPTSIQEQAIPHILNGHDLLGCAQTGTGKTAAFSLPLLQLLHNKHSGSREKKKIKALILTPTRELALQIGESIETYGRNLNLSHTVIFGGVPQARQTHALQRGIDILVATPGRLLDLMNQGFIHLSNVEFFVLDEADRMLDMGFIHDVKRVLLKLPQKKQSLFFSATLAPEIKQLASSILVNPERVEVTPVSSAAVTVNQTVYFVEKTNKKALLLHLLENSKLKQVLVFTRTKHGADRVAKDLNKVGIKAAAIHGNKSQNARQLALSNFKTNDIRVLVATDIAARGIDIDNLAYVINYELPNEPETYVHRIGRTGRAGASGNALSFCDAEERAYLKQINKLISQNIAVVEDHPYATDFPNAGAADTNSEPPKRDFRRNNPNRPKSNSGSNKSHSGNPKTNSGANSGGPKSNSGGPKRWFKNKKNNTKKS